MPVVRIVGRPTRKHYVIVPIRLPIGPSIAEFISDTASDGYCKTSNISDTHGES